MAAPVINLTTSVLGYGQWEPWSYQPWATGLLGGTSDTWTSSALPSGMSIDARTGAISGAATQAGVYNVGLQVSNVNGTSAAIMLTIGIEARAYSNHSGTDMFVNTSTGEVTLSLTGTSTGASTGTMLAVKEGENRLLYLTFHKDGTVLELDPASGSALANLELALKEYEPEGMIVCSKDDTVDVNFLKTGTGTNTVYILHTKFDGAALKASLSNYEEDTGTLYSGIAEIAWQEPNATLVGPATLQRRSRTFNITVERNIAP